MSNYSFNYYFNQYWEEVQDHRSTHLILIHNVSPWFALWLASCYVLYAKVVGPAIMKNREPFVLRGWMLFYNVIMAFFNVIAFVGALILCDYGRKFLNFDYPDTKDMSEFNIWQIHLGFLYWCTKFLDLIDTLFFVARKKYSHITFLHLYHHTIVPVFGFLLFKLNPLLPAVYLFGIINAFIHVVMYSYYALAAFGPEVKKYLWWKKYITQMQLFQFMIYGLYGVIMFFFQRGYPVVWFYIGLTQPPLFFWLFYDFYQKAYEDRQMKKAD